MRDGWIKKNALWLPGCIILVTMMAILAMPLAFPSIYRDEVRYRQHLFIVGDGIYLRQRSVRVDVLGWTETQIAFKCVYDDGRIGLEIVKAIDGETAYVLGLRVVRVRSSRGDITLGWDVLALVPENIPAMIRTNDLLVYVGGIGAFLVYLAYLLVQHQPKRHKTGEAKP